jgi:hypothetical protein
MSISPISATHRGSETDASHASVYTCPMHPEVRSAQGGRCPKCGMALEASPSSNGHVARQRRFSIGACVFLAVPAFYLWTEHRAHLLGALPYLIALLYPAMHFFMHRGHHNDHSDHSDSAHEH